MINDVLIHGVTSDPAETERPGEVESQLSGASLSLSPKSFYCLPGKPSVTALLFNPPITLNQRATFSPASFKKPGVCTRKNTEIQVVHHLHCFGSIHSRLGIAVCYK